MAKLKREAKTNVQQRTYCIHVLIGLAIVALFWFVLPAPDPITPVGMRVVGAFLCMVYLWSTAEILLPSILGLLLVGLSGIGGDGGFVSVIVGALGSDMPLIILFGMILFGAVDAQGATSYIAKWILTRKLIAGRPFAFLALFFACCWVLGFLMTPMYIILLLWPVAPRIMDAIGATREDSLWKRLFVGTFFAAILGHPFLPFYDAPLIAVGTFQGMMASMGYSGAYPKPLLARFLPALAPLTF